MDAKKALAAAMGYTDQQVKNVQAGGVSDSYIQDQITNNPTVASKVTMDEVNTQVNELLTEKDYDSRLELLESRHGLSDIQDNTDWNNIKEVIDSGNGKRYYPIGTQIIDNYSYDGVEYEVPHNIVHYDTIELEDGTEKNAMFLEWEYTTPLGIPFCAPQALQTFDGTDGSTDGLPQGKYAVYIHDFTSDWKVASPIFKNKYIVFTLTKDIPSGGQIRSSTIGNTEVWKIKTTDGYLYNATTLETVTCEVSDTLPSDATFLGKTCGEDVGYGILNHIECVANGDNTWRDSDLRMWLNSDSDTWWEKKTRYSVQPSCYTKKGFLSGYSEEFKQLLKPIKVQSYSNNVKEKEGIIITYDKVFLHSNRQMNATTDNNEQFNTDNEGNIWEYYKELSIGSSNLDLSGRFKVWNTYDILKRFAINAKTSAQVIFGRSSRRAYGCVVFRVSPYGTVDSYLASTGYRCLPACVICK